MRIIAAAALYFLIVFGAGFLLGPVRVFWLEPRLGETIAALCEAPFLLVAIILAAQWVPRTLRLRRNVSSLTVMGLGALIYVVEELLFSSSRNVDSAIARMKAEG